MTRAHQSGRRLLPWLAVALFGAAAGIAIQLSLGSSNDTAAVTLVANAPATESSAPSTSVPVSAPDAPSAGVAPRAEAAPLADLAGPEPAAGESASSGPEGSTQAGAAVAPPPHLSAGIRLRVPTLGIDAEIVTLGFTGDGQLDVPAEGSAVGWYDISPRPGTPGNALLGAHLDWNGSLAVFARLSELRQGDQIVINDGARGDRIYEVSVSTSIGWNHPLVDVLAAEGSGSSLTLFTCGGSFDAVRSEYDERVLVRAIEVTSTDSLTAAR